VSGCAIPRFVVILDRPARDLIDWQSGADLIQLREKAASEAEVEALTRKVVSAVGNPLQVSVNGHPVIAELLGCHLHLPEARREIAPAHPLAPGACLSRSVHGPVRDESADYVILGNVFATKSKPGADGIGLYRLAKWIEKAGLPVVAIGGITPDRVGPVITAGAHGVAVRSFVIGSDDPQAAARQIRQELDAWVK
jgi:thiazole tautomerase (transcriptional regulator TenI)